MISNIEKVFLDILRIHEEVDNDETVYSITIRESFACGDFV
jgi:hypothetical protein